MGGDIWRHTTTTTSTTTISILLTGRRNNLDPPNFNCDFDFLDLDLNYQPRPSRPRSSRLAEGSRWSRRSSLIFSTSFLSTGPRQSRDREGGSTFSTSSFSTGPRQSRERDCGSVEGGSVSPLPTPGCSASSGRRLR